ncbi:YdeI/OmpD-associated family protein [Dehalogenimonas sp. 4OHTPN]|uniref:YdeI/OmpD-associated family protein n=1 Tax=Dehalogenimonas sp. 4OHTPN TaxID=3166643 RepID=A0AAU8GAZ1_9CHLR
MNIEPLVFADAAGWKSWLAANHDKAGEAWVVHYKVKSPRSGLRYGEALKEAIAYGWIDGKMKSLDGDRFMLRYTPRKSNSIWSQRNKDIANGLIRQGKMAEAGMAAVEAARANGKWDNAYSNRAVLAIPEDLRQALELDLDKIAAVNFLSLPNSSRNMYIRWVENARTEGTRRLRITRVVSRAQDNVKPG